MITSLIGCGKTEVPKEVQPSESVEAMEEVEESVDEGVEEVVEEEVKEEVEEEVFDASSYYTIDKVHELLPKENVEFVIDYDTMQMKLAYADEDFKIGINTKTIGYDLYVIDDTYYAKLTDISSDDVTYMKAKVEQNSSTITESTPIIAMDEIKEVTYLETETDSNGKNIDKLQVIVLDKVSNTVSKSNTIGEAVDETVEIKNNTKDETVTESNDKEVDNSVDKTNDTDLNETDLNETTASESADEESEETSESASESEATIESVYVFYVDRDSNTIIQIDYEDEESGTLVMTLSPITTLELPEEFKDADETDEYTVLMSYLGVLLSAMEDESMTTETTETTVD